MHLAGSLYGGACRWVVDISVPVWNRMQTHMYLSTNILFAEKRKSGNGSYLSITVPRWMWLIFLCRGSYGWEVHVAVPYWNWIKVIQCVCKKNAHPPSWQPHKIFSQTKMSHCWESQRRRLLNFDRIITSWCAIRSDQIWKPVFYSVINIFFGENVNHPNCSLRCTKQFDKLNHTKIYRQ